MAKGGREFVVESALQQHVCRARRRTDGLTGLALASALVACSHCAVQIKKASANCDPFCLFAAARQAETHTESGVFQHSILEFAEPAPVVAPYRITLAAALL